MKHARYFLVRLVPYIAVGLGLLVFKSAWLALVGYHIGILLVFAACREWRQFRRVRVIFHPLWAGFAWAGSIMAGFWLYNGWNGLPLPADLSAQMTEIGLTPQRWPLFIAYFALVNPWLEETYWRGWLSSRVKFPVVDDLWFAGYHTLILLPYVSWIWLVLAILILTGAAWFWRQVARDTNSLFIPAVAHGFADFSILMAIYLRTVYP